MKNAKEKVTAVKENIVELTKAEQVEALKTREYKLTEGKRDCMFISKAKVKSKAWLSLKTSAACQVYTLFMTKCLVERRPIKPGCNVTDWVIKNNGKIQFTYMEALKKWGIKNGKFRKAIDELIRVGLVDIIHSGFGLYKDVTLYALSNRWKKFGTDKFIVKERTKRKSLGFRKGNAHGKDSKQNQQLSTAVEQQLSVTVKPESEVA